MEEGVYEILEASKLEVQSLFKLVNSAYRGETSRKGWTTEADLLDGIRIDEEELLRLIEKEESKLFIYIEKNQILGCINLEQKENELYLGMLTVTPELQGKGIGKKLLQYAENYGRTNKFDRIEMTVITQRTELIDWYIRHGYNKTGEKRPFPMNNPRFGEPTTHLEFIVLRKNLTL